MIMTDRCSTVPVFFHERSMEKNDKPDRETSRKKSQDKCLTIDFLSMVDGFCIIAWSDAKFLFEFTGEVMYGGKAEHGGDLRDRMCALFDQQLSFIELQVADILFWSNFQILFE